MGGHRYLDEELLQKRYALLVSCPQCSWVLDGQLRWLHEKRTPSPVSAGNGTPHRVPPRLASEGCGEFAYFIPVQARRGVNLVGRRVAQGWAGGGKHSICQASLIHDGTNRLLLRMSELPAHVHHH